MADSIQITFEGIDDTGRATNSAVANIDRLGKAAKNVNSEFVSSGTIMAKYSNAQYQSAKSAEVLMNKSNVLAQAVQRGKITVDQAREAYARYEKQEQRNIWSSMTAGEKYKTVSQRLESMQASMMKVTLAGAGVVVAGKAIYDFAKSGAELEYTKTRFDRLSVSMGATGDVMMSQLKVATKGTLSDMELAKQGADLFQLGLAGSAEEAVRLSKVMTALGMDTGELTLALANQSKRRLDQLGLSLTKFNEIESKLRDKGLSKEQAFKEAFLQTAEQTIVTTGNRADSSYGNFMRLEASGKNLMDTVKQQAPDMGMGWLFGGDSVSETAQKVSMFMNGVTDLMKGNTVFDMSGGLGADSYVRQAMASDKSDLWKRRVTSSGMMAPTTQLGLSAVQNYTAMAYKYGQGGAGLQGPEAEAVPVDYAALTEGAMKLTAANEKYAEGIAKITAQYDDNKVVREMFKEDVTALKDQLRDGEITNSQYYDSVQKLTSAWKDGSFAAQKQRNAIGELEKAQDAQGAAFALSMMQADEAYDPQNAYDFAAATGLITKEAAEQYKAFDKVKGALGSSALSAEQSAYAVRALSGDIEALNGMTSEAWIDVYIRTHGSMILPGMDTEGNVIGARRHGGEVGFASGGTGITPGIYNVGEQGTEGLYVGKDGNVSVVDATTWQKMKAYGIPASGGFAGGLAASAAQNLKTRGGSLRRPGTNRSSSSIIAPGISLDTSSSDTMSQEPAKQAEKQMNAYTQAMQQQNDLLASIDTRLAKQSTKADDYAVATMATRTAIQ